MVIVLAAAALAASLTQAPRRGETGRRAGPPPALEPAPNRPQAEFSTRGRPQKRSLPAGVSATVTVRADRAGTVELPRLGLLAPVESGTPANFAVLLGQGVSTPVVFTPTGGRPRRVGTLRPRPRGSAVRPGVQLAGIGRLAAEVVEVVA